MTFRTLMAGPIARGTVFSLMIRLVGIALGVAQALLTARLLGPEGYGSVAYVISLSMLFATIVLLGTEHLAVREVARLRTLGETARLKGFLRAIRVLVCGVALITALAAAVILPKLGYLDPEFRSVIGYSAILFPIFALILQNQGVLRGYGKTVMSQVPFQVLRQIVLVSFLATVWVVGLEIGPKGYLNAALAGAIVALAVVVFVLSRNKLANDVPAQTPTLGWLGSNASPFFIGSVLALLLGEITTLMLAWWTDAEQTGLFQPIARIAPLIMLGAHAASVRYGPRVSELLAKGEFDRIKAITRAFTLTTTAFAIISSVTLLLLGKWILGLFGEAYTVNITALWWIAGAQIFNAACGPVWSLLVMSGNTARTIAPQLLGLLAHVTLGAFLIPESGAMGAAIAMSGGIVIWNIAMLVQVRRVLPIDPTLFSSFKRQV